jgi:hypothetical protein
MKRTPSHSFIAPSGSSNRVDSAKSEIPPLRGGISDFAKRVLLTVHLVVILLAALTGTVRPASTAHAQDIAAYCISDLDASKWPEVALTLRPVDSAGAFVADLTTLAIYEGDTAASDVKLAPLEGPLQYAVLVDGGRAPARATKTLIQRAVGVLGASSALRGGDTVLVRVLKNDSTRQPSSETSDSLPWTTDAAAVRTFAALDFVPANRTRTKPIDAVDALIRDIGDRVGSPIQTPVVVVLITHNVEASNGDPESDARAVADQLRKQGIGAYVLHTGTGGAAALRSLASPTGGYLQITAKTDAQLEQLLQSASRSRRSYRVTYTSRFPGSGPRPVTINAPGNAPACPANNSYDQVAGAPEIAFTGLPDQIAFNAEKSVQNVTVNVKWPGGSARPIESANLLIDGQRRGKGDIKSNGSVIEFAFQDRDVVGKSEIALEVELVEANGRTTSSAPRRVRISGEQPAVLVPQPTVAPAPTENQGASPLVLALLGILVVGVLAIAGLLGAMLLRRSKAASARKVVGGLTAQVQASLTVLDGPHGRKGEKIGLSKTRYVIGRQGADIVFFADAARSTVSRVHCTITRDADMSFWVTDNVSSNGTRVNGTLVTGNERHALNNGDQLLLGDVDRNGVLLVFALDHPTQFIRRSEAA